MRTGAQRTLVGAGALLVGGLVVGAVALTRLGSGHGSAVKAPNLKAALTANGGAPQPPPRAVVLAGESGDRAVALAVERGTRRRLTVTVLAGTGDALSGLAVSFRLGSGARAFPARPCGRGCYTALAPAGAPVRTVEVLLPGRPVTFRLPAAARPAAQIVRRATRVFRRLRSLVYVESLRSGPTGGILTTWRMSAPDRLSYRIRGGASAVVIGERRWDQERPGGQWTRSQQIPALQVPQPTWVGRVIDAHVLGTGRVGGRPVWIVSFVDPTVPAWFTAWIDRRSYRTLQLRMTAAAHFMFHRYESFDRPLRIKPPG